jgi:hypothetical protein
MKNARKSVTIFKSPLSKEIAAKDDAAANAEEVEEQMEEDNVEKKAAEDATAIPASSMSGSEGSK